MNHRLITLPLASLLLVVAVIGCGSESSAQNDQTSTPETTTDSTVTFDSTPEPDNKADGRTDEETTLPPVNKAPFFDPIPTVTMKMGASTTVEIMAYVADPDNTDTQLTISFSPKHVALKMLDDGKLLVVAPVDWNGTELIPITATDPGELADTEQLAFDFLAVCIGRRPDLSLLHGLGLDAPKPLHRGVDAIPGLFAAGDLLRTDERFVALAVADGEAAAENVHKYLLGNTSMGGIR